MVYHGFFQPKHTLHVQVKTISRLLVASQILVCVQGLIMLMFTSLQ